MTNSNSAPTGFHNLVNLDIFFLTLIVGSFLANSPHLTDPESANRPTSIRWATVLHGRAKTNGVWRLVFGYLACVAEARGIMLSKYCFPCVSDSEPSIFKYFFVLFPNSVYPYWRLSHTTFKPITIKGGA